MNNYKNHLTNIFIIASLALIISTACSEDNSGLAPYVGSPEMSTITIEEESFTPKVTWIGGYASVFGVNKGKRATLDTSLVWLVKADGNNLKYPVKFGDPPSNAIEITSQFGGTKLDSLQEDEDYTFWVLKEEVWERLSNEIGKTFVADPSLDEGEVISDSDSLFISTTVFASLAKRLDVFINIDGISTFGQLGVISIQETRSNRPIISWTITQSGVTDTAISVIGIAEGNQFDPGKTVWEIYSETTENGTPVFGKLNVITSPLNVGDSIPQTRAFVPFNKPGLDRNKTYYIWIANDIWNGEGRLRFEPGYAYATFNTR
ncbi:hypothetical protein ASZ90_005003 [hydrocarbon metagenome]|uniref:Uncharacterized protein n=1 Tax=hydrocarbon metagenome TaxID=938273 RepID=A0A0W8FWG9_9ZZZZ